MKRSWISFICIVLCILIPFATVALTILALPAQFHKTFLAALEVKIDRIESVDEPKIIVVGGSSVPFGVDTKLMEQMLGMPSVNFGLYATLGTKLMLDLSREYINEGDIIVIAPETDAQTYSLFFNAEASWQAVDSDLSLLPKIAKKNLGAMLGGAWKFAGQKLAYATGSKTMNLSGVYQLDSFDEYGDITYPREYNKMSALYDSSFTINPSPDIISDDFVDYVNEYVAYAEKKGARVLFSFAPMNMDAIDSSVTNDSIKEFETFIKENFDSELISNPNYYIYESGYFYDSNFHLNDAGTVMHTVNLSSDIAKALGKELQNVPEIPDIPEIPADSGKDFPTDYDENEKYFIFEERYVAGEHVGYNIIGVSELGKTQTVLTTPYAYNGKLVYDMASNTFSGCASLTEIYLTENIESLGNGAFADAPMLQKIHILSEDPDGTRGDSFGSLIDGMASGAKFYVKAEFLSSFENGYYWNIYANIIEAE